MDEFTITAMIKAITLNQRNIYCQFKKETGVNKSCVEVLTLANTTTTFNPYEAQMRFGSMNLQQIRLSIRYLNDIGAIELIRPGLKNKPAVYMITGKGKLLLQEYNNVWIGKFNNDNSK